MRQFESRIDTSGSEFEKNAAAYADLLATLRERQQFAISGGAGRERSIERHHSRGKILPRDRIDLVCDADTPFLELSTLAGWDMYDNSAPGAGIVTGIGMVHGVPWMFIANDATVKGGSLLPISIKKHVRAQDIAAENGLGIIYLVDSGGAFLPLQDDIFPDKDHFGGSFYRQARLSANQRPVDHREGWLSWTAPEAPHYDPAEIYGVISADDRIGFDAREVIARLVDGSRYSEFKPEWGEHITCGFARIWGHQVGIVANNGIIFSSDALKATHFIELCEQRRVPLLFLQNTTGYMVGSDSEAAGIAKHGAKMVSAVANATVPRYTVLIGGSYGAGNYGMCGRGFNPRFLFAWPNSRIATMSAETAQTVLVDIRLAGMRGTETTESEIAAMRAEVAAQYEQQSDPYYATARLWDDGLIDPVDTRDALGLCLALAARQDAPAVGSGIVYRM